MTQIVHWPYITHTYALRVVSNNETLILAHNIHDLW